MSAWDLTCRLEQPSLKPSVAPPAVAPPAATITATTLKMIDGQRIYQCQQNPPTSLWQKLTFDEQLQALLATATRAVALKTTANVNNLTPTTNLIPQLNQIQSLNKQLPVGFHDVIDPALIAGNPGQDRTINHLASRLQLLQANKQYSVSSGLKLANQSSGLSRSLTPSPSSSSRSNSTESIDLSFSKRIPPLVASNSDENNNSTTDSSIISMSSQASRSSSSRSSSCSSSSGGTAPRAGSVLGVTDKRARKKDQNRRAAFNYRRKKMEERDKMIEEEARLVHEHVRLAGKIARLEDKILSTLSTKTKQIHSKARQAMCHLCPVCSELCDNVATLRNHLRAKHFQLLPQEINSLNLCNNDNNTMKQAFGCDDSNHDDEDGNHYDGSIHSSLYTMNHERSVNNNFVGDNVSYNDEYDNNDSNSLM